MIKEIQEERGKVYGEFHDHMAAASSIMLSLKLVHLKKNKKGMSEDFEIALFYMITKLVRLSTTPTHEDSALDLASYAQLWLKEIQDDNKSSIEECQNPTTQDR